MSDNGSIDTVEEQARRYIAHKYGRPGDGWDVLMARRNIDGTEFEVVLQLDQIDTLGETVTGIGSSLKEACDKAVIQTRP